MDSPTQPTPAFVIASINFGGGARAVPTATGHPTSRPNSLAQFLTRPNPAQTHPDLPTVATIQEMTRLMDPPEDHAGELLGHLKNLHPSRFYVPTVNTEWYPLPNKWAARWKEGVRKMEQGMITLALRNADMFDPQLNPQHSGLVITLPTIQFVDPATTTPNDLTQHVTLPNSNTTLHYQHARYLGNRDTEPRTATAHRIRITQQRHHDFILINVHLGTLNEENRIASLRANRVPTPNATALRFLQLDVLRRFIDEVYRDLKLPVIVAGDFNANPESPELTWFQKQTRTEMVFKSAAICCWKCHQPVPPAQSKNLFTRADINSLLTTTAEEFTTVTGQSDSESIAVAEWCPHCDVPLFTHKRNFTIIDNILYTSPETSASLRLHTSIAPTPDHGIRLDTYFSDHLPIWASFSLNQ